MKIFLRNTLILFCLFFLKSILAHESSTLKLFQNLTNQELWKVWENNAVFWQNFTQGLRCQARGLRMGRLLEIYSFPPSWRFILETLGDIKRQGNTFFEPELLMWQKFCGDISKLEVVDVAQQSQGNCMIDLALRLFDSRIEQMQNFFELCFANWYKRIVPAAGFLCITLEKYFNDWAKWHKKGGLRPILLLSQNVDADVQKYNQDLLKNVIEIIKNFRDDLKFVADQAKSPKKVST